MIPDRPPSPPPALRAVPWAASLALLALAGCATPAGVAALSSLPPSPAPAGEPSTAPPVADAPPPAALEAALQYADRVRGLPGGELAAEIAALGKAGDASAEGALRLALALVQTRQPADTARALGLAQRVLGEAQAAALHPLARLLEARLLQQRRLEEQLDRQAHQLREAQRRNDQLSERLEAMRALERSLNSRPARGGAAPAPAAEPR